MALWFFTEVVSFLLVSLFELVLGIVAFLFVGRLAMRFGIFGGSASDLSLPDSSLFPGCYVFGLLLHLSAVFFLKCLGCSWAMAVILPLFPIAFLKGEIVRISSVFRPRLTLNRLLWVSLSLLLGISLFDARGGITTPWKNNYGDLAFHTGMITSFVFGNNFPPEYHIFPGVRLSYPFFADLWTAGFWWIQPSFYSLSVLFALQWMIVWILVYHALDGDRVVLAPWALLFGGGALHFAFDYSKTGTLMPADGLISNGYPWAPFLTTIWVTQRPALLGLACLLTAARLIHGELMACNRDGEIGSRVFTPKLILGVLVLAFMPLVHAHFALVGVLYAFSSFLWRHRFGFTMGTPVAALSGALKKALLFASFFLPALLFLPWLIGKVGLFGFQAGWMPWPPCSGKGVLVCVERSASMWMENAWVWLLFLCLLLVPKGGRRSGVILLILFLVGNGLEIAEWQWDQIKVFVAIYALGISAMTAIGLSRPRNIGFQALLLLLMIPSLFELFRVFSSYEDFEVYSEEAVNRGAEIRAVTEPGAIILGSPDHNSLVTLTGRRLYLGYEGTLASHGIRYERRKRMASDLSAAIECTRLGTGLQKPCPRYLLGTKREIAYWDDFTEISKGKAVSPIYDYFFRIEE